MSSNSLPLVIDWHARGALIAEVHFAWALSSHDTLDESLIALDFHRLSVIADPFTPSHFLHGYEEHLDALIESLGSEAVALASVLAGAL